MTDMTTSESPEQTTTGSLGGASEPTGNVPEQQAQQPQQPQQQSDAPWYSSMPDDIKGYMETKGFKNQEALARSYQSLEKTIGVPEDELFRVRSDMRDEDLGKLYNRLGRPESADDYTLKAGEGDIPELVDWFKGIAHKNGLSDAHTNEFYQAFNEQVQGIADRQSQEVEAKNSEAITTLRKEWGSKREFNDALVDRAGEALNLSPEFLSAVRKSGHSADMMRMLVAYGQTMAEGELHGNNNGQMVGKTVNEAKSQIADLQRDANFMKAYFDGNSPTHKQAVKQMEDLNRIIVNSQQ